MNLLPSVYRYNGFICREIDAPDGDAVSQFQDTCVPESLYSPWWYEAHIPGLFIGVPYVLILLLVHSIHQHSLSCTPTLGAEHLSTIAK